MGWGTGTDLFKEVSEILQENISDPIDRKRIYYDLIRIFEDYDADNLCELLDNRGIDKAFVEAFNEINPIDDEEFYNEDDFEEF